MSTDRSFTTTHAGPIVLDLTQNSGRIDIAVNPLAKATTVVVTTGADSGPSADAVTDARFTEADSKLTVNIPTPSGGGSNMVISGGSVIVGGYSGSSITVGHGSGPIIVNGVDVTEMVNKGAGGKTTQVVTTVIVPTDSEVLMSTHTANVTVRGDLKALDYGSSSGTLTAEGVGELSVNLTSGDARVQRVTERLNATLSSGDLLVSSYSGSDGRLSLTSGDATIHATPQARGRFSVGLTSGDAKLTGAGHLDVRKRVTSGNLRVS